MIRLSRRTFTISAALALSTGLAACSDSSETTETTEEAPAKAVTETPETSTPATAAVEAPEANGTVDMTKVMAKGKLEDRALGDANAPVTIVEYMSMTCPHCRDFHENTFPALKEKYIDTGKVRFVMREFPFDPRAAAAIMLSRCAPENQFFPMVDVLFKQQSVWATAEDGRAALLDIARLAGFTQEAFDACLTDQQLLDDVNNVRKQAAEEFGVDATPTFLINGKRYSGSKSIEQMSAIIDPLL